MDISRRLFSGSLILLLMTGSVALWGEAIGLALFITHVGIESLPLALALEALLSLLIISGAEQLEGRIPLGILLALITVAGMSLLAVGRGLIENDSLKAGYLCYFLARRLIRDLLVYYTWHYLASYYNVGMRYLLPRLALFSRVGYAASGFGLVILTWFLTPLEIIWLWGGMLLLAFIVIGVFADEFQNIPRAIITADNFTSAPATRLRNAIGSLLRSDLMLLLTLGAFCTIFLSSLIIYLTRDIFVETLSQDMELIRWLALLGGLSSLVMLPVQFSAVPYAFKRLPLPYLSSIYPGILGAAFLAILSVPAMALAAFGELTRNALQTSLYDPLSNQMKNTLPVVVRNWERIFLEGLAEPLGRLSAAGLLVLYVEGTLPSLVLAIIGGVAALAFVVSQYQAGRLHTDDTKKSLAAGQYSFLRTSVLDSLSATHEVVDKLLERLSKLSPGDRNILLIVQALAESGSEEGFEAVMRLWSRSPLYIQSELLQQIVEGWSRRRKTQAVQILVLEALESDHPELRRAALQVMTNFPSLLDSFRVAHYLIDPEPTISTLAAQLLLKSPSLTLARAAKAQLNWLSRASNAPTRALAVSALVDGGVDRFGQRMVPLDVERFQADPSARVRMAIVPGASPPALINGVRDVSSPVQQLAIQQLAQHKRQGMRLLKEAIATTGQEKRQIHVMIEHWYLLTALASINPYEGRKIVLDEIKHGLWQIDTLSAMRTTLRTLKYPPLAPLFTQLSHDRAHLMQAVWNFMGAIFGVERVRAVTRTLQSQTDSAECEAAMLILNEVTTPQLGQQISRLISTPHEVDLLVTGDPSTKFEDPAQVIDVLLAQADDWRPLLALYSLSALPRPIFEALTKSEQIERILENGRKSDQDAIREGTRLIRRALSDESVETRADSELSRIQPLNKEESSHMLSAIERMLFLRNVSFFENLRLDQLRTLARICVEQAFNPGEFIIRKGEAGDSLFILVEGRIQIVNPEGSNRSAVLATMSDGDVIGEISLFDGGLRSADAVALTNCLLLVVHREALDDALADDPGIAMDMLRVMAQRIRQSNRAFAEVSQQLNQQNEL